MSVRHRVFLLVLIDIVIVASAVILAYLLRFDFQVKPDVFRFIPYVLIMHLLIVIPFFYLNKLYKRIWQFASVGELISILKSVAYSEIIFYALHNLIIKFIYPNIVVPRSIYLLSGMLIIAGIGGSRIAWRLYRDSYLKIQPHHNRALIVGAGIAGALIAKELKHSTSTSMYPVAFIDDDPNIQSLEVLGLPIVGLRADIPIIVENYNIQEIIIAIPSAPNSEIAKIIDICKTTMVNVKILPRVSDIVDGTVSINLIRDVSIDDLLGREPVDVDLNEIANYVQSKTVLITGAGGSIGSELCRQLAPFSPDKLLLLGHGENSIYDIELELRRTFPELKIETIIADSQDRNKINEVFSLYRPNVVFHAAAHKHVPLMERNPSEAIKNNIFGTKNVAECAHKYRTSHFVMISTDKAVNPSSVMGATKRVAEMLIQDLSKSSKTKFATVRFGNVLGSRGSVIPIFKQQISQGGPVTVTHPEMVRYFMTIPEAVQLVIQAGSFAQGGEIFILDMGKPVKIADLARDLIKLSGLEPDVDIDIQYTGIRPGEKLYEELLTAEEGTKATKHDRIYTGNPIEMNRNNFLAKLKRLEQAVYSGENNITNEEYKVLLKQIVPSYNYLLSTINKKDLESELARQELMLTKLELASSKVN